MKKFPKIIHVTREIPANDDSYLNVHEDGPPDDADETQPCAIYQLVEVGKVVVDRRFVSGKKAT